MDADCRLPEMGADSDVDSFRSVANVTSGKGRKGLYIKECICLIVNNILT